MNLFRPNVLLRLEALGVFLASLAFYRVYEGSWLTFGLLFFAPDISIALYMLSPAAGYRAYNVAHTYLLPALLAAVLTVMAPADMALALIWFAHIAWDRMLALGLKQNEDFWDTHLGRIVAGKRLWQRFNRETA